MGGVFFCEIFIGLIWKEDLMKKIKFLILIVLLTFSLPFIYGGCDGGAGGGAGWGGS